MNRFEFYDQFVNRHIGPREEDIPEMLNEIGVNSIEELIDKTIPENIRLKKGLNLDEALTEEEFLKRIRKIAAKNKVFKSYIGMGYYPTITPAVILRNVLENPGWYTQYTPYQAEISQGRLEAMLNFQTMTVDLTGLPLANASLLDEGTAAAEAMRMFYASRKKEKKNAETFLVAAETFPQTIAVLKKRAEPIGINLKILPVEEFEFTEDVFGILVQFPDDNGEAKDFTELFAKAKESNVFVGVAADLLSLALLTPPGEIGADAVFGNSQRFGVPMAYGGPHAAYFAAKEEFKRQLPGRIIGVSKDKYGRMALRMALQTREQHIKRERATSNICTAQALLADMAGFYAVYHGPKGIKAIAERIHNFAQYLNKALQSLGFEQANKTFFDTLKIKTGSKDLTGKIKETALRYEVNFRYFENGDVGISIGEPTTLEDVKEIVRIFAEASGKNVADWDFEFEEVISGNLKRRTSYLTHPIFNSFHSETEMMRYIKRLENKDLSLMHSMISLGSCTMKLNAASEMIGITLPEFANIHPFAPIEQAAGYREIIKELEDDLKEITGLAGVSLMPNSGAQGEYTGLSVIREYHKSRGEAHRNVVLIPSSAHGTNPASAVMAGNKVVIVACGENGDVDLDDLRAKAEEYRDNLAALMITYPSTHGIFEENIREMCQIVHNNGGLVYMDGANMNAQVGLTSPKMIGADVCHLNLHKTFGIPHGGGGPGVGPIAVDSHLVDFLPTHPVVKVGGERGILPTASAPWGSAGIFPISYGYIKMLGKKGVKRSSEIAILNANYIKAKLEKHFRVYYVGERGFVGHELIFDLNEFKKTAGVEADDVAKRLMDYGFHAPTVAFPVHGTVMVEPTESESKEELDRFCEAMISIRHEIEEIAEGKYSRENNVLKNAPHTVYELVEETWKFPYSKQKAFFPLDWVREHKFWTSVNRIDNAYGDRNLVCYYPLKNQE